MTQKRDFKVLVRERMARTGESYSTARRHVSAQRPDGGGERIAEPPCWRPYERTSELETERLVVSALALEPRLRDVGFDRLDDFVADDDFVRRAVQARIAESHMAVAECAGWIADHVDAKGATAIYDAAEAQHIVQRLVDLRGGPRLWRPFVIPSAFIAAAVGLRLERWAGDQGSAFRFRFLLSKAGVMRSRREITDGVCSGRGVRILASSGPNLMGGAWRSAARLVHFLDLEPVGFVGVVDAGDPEGGPYTRCADVPTEGEGAASVCGFRRLTSSEMDAVDYDAIGDIDDYSGPKHSD